MSGRRTFQCPTCKTTVVGALLDEPRNVIRCDYKILGWGSTIVGKDKKTGLPMYEYTPSTKPGCGGILSLCVHGLRVCVSCPPQFTEGFGQHSAHESLAELMKREAHDAEHRRELLKEQLRRAERDGQNMPSQTTGHFHMPFLGEAEPERYKGPTGRRKR